MRCYTCGQLSHMSWDCPENVARRGEAQVVQAEPEAPQELEEVVAYLEDGEALLMRKTIEEPIQRRSLFKSVCKVEGKCCKLIVDSGSIDNLASTEMVDKLNLRKTVHPEPYRVAWLQKVHQVLVKEQCQVKFQIRSYKDEVICEIIEMDACHILLGRPWHFERELVHEGKRNVYSFEMNGKKHSLHPLKGKQEEANN